MFSLPEFKEQSRLERKEYITLFWGGGGKLKTVSYLLNIYLASMDLLWAD